MSNQQVYRVAAVLVGGAALLLILERLWALARMFQDIILLFALAWLIAFTLTPLVEWLKQPYGIPFLRARFSSDDPSQPPRQLFSHAGAVTVVYTLMGLGIVIGVGSVLPVALEQGQNLGKAAPELPNRLPVLMGDLEIALARVGIVVDLPNLYQANVAPIFKDLAGTVFREFMGALSTIAAAMANLVLVIILSLYMSLGGRDLAHEFATLFPRRFRQELLVFVVNVNRTFGGFVRGQLFQALLTGLATAALMLGLRLDYVALAAVFSAILMLIPLIGAVLTLIPPLTVALVLGSLPTALLVLIALFVFQQVLINAVMPKVMSESVGLHPLLVLAALLVGIRLGGVWGAFFGIPVAGVLYAMLGFLIKRWRQREAEAQTQA